MAARESTKQMDYAENIIWELLEQKKYILHNITTMLQSNYGHTDNNLSRL